MRKLRIIFLGRKHWSARALEYLLEQGHEVVAVVCQPKEKELDYNKGSLIESATSNGIPHFNSKDFYSYVQANPSYFAQIDLVISYLFWEKIKEPLLSLAKWGCINFHPGPLPELRGFGVYAFAILKGLDQYGVTVHHVNSEIDKGDIIKVKKFSISAYEETAVTLEQKSQVVMYELFKETINAIGNGEKLPRKQQDESAGEYFSRTFFEEQKKVLPSDSREIIDKKIRAFWFPPYQGAYLEVNGQRTTLVNETILKSVSEILHNNENKNMDFWSKNEKNLIDNNCKKRGEKY